MADKFVTYEERMWIPQTSIFYVPRRDRQNETVKYSSAVIKDLSRLDVVFDSATQKLIQDTIEELSKVDGYLKDKTLSFPMLLLRTEALSSSQIEHYHASNRNIALAHLKYQNNMQANIVSANLDALVQSLNNDRTLSLQDIQVVHSFLMKSIDPEQARKIREIPNWIGKSSLSPLLADYVPPHPILLPEYLGQLITFICRTDLHPLVIAAFSHAYFETIHPFTDGNGRTGRVLIQMILHQSGFLENLHIPISVGIVKDTKKYIETLAAFRDGDYQKVVQFVCRAALNVVPKVYTALESIDSIKHTWGKNIQARSDAFVWKILDEIIAQPVIDVAYLVEKFQMNDQAVRNNIDILLQSGILSRVDNARRNVVYETKEILHVMDVFVNDVESI